MSSGTQPRAGAVALRFPMLSPRGFASSTSSRGECFQGMTEFSAPQTFDLMDALNQRDWDAALKDVHPDFKFDFSRAVGPVRGVFKLDQMRPFMDEFFGL